MCDELTRVVAVTPERFLELLVENERLRTERDSAIKHCVYMTSGYSDQEIASDVAEATGIDLGTVLAAAGIKPPAPTEPAPEVVCPECKSIRVTRHRSSWPFVHQCSNCGHVWWSRK